MERRLPILSSVKEVFSGVSSHFFQLVAAAWIWLLIGYGAWLWLSHVLAQTGIQNMMPAEIGQVKMDAAVSFQIAMCFVVYIIATAGAAVKWHRCVLVSDEAAVMNRNIAHDAFRYVWVTIKVGFVYVLLLIILTGAITLAGSLGDVAGRMLSLFALAAFFVTGIPALLRLSMAMPDVALGGAGSLRDMFARTAGMGMQILAYAVLILLGIILVAVIASTVLGIVFAATVGLEAARDPSPSVRLLMDIAKLPVSVFGMMIGVTMLSVAYRELIGLSRE